MVPVWIPNSQKRLVFSPLNLENKELNPIPIIIIIVTTAITVTTVTALIACHSFNLTVLYYFLDSHSMSVQ